MQNINYFKQMTILCVGNSNLKEIIVIERWLKSLLIELELTS